MSAALRRIAGFLLDLCVSNTRVPLPFIGYCRFLGMHSNDWLLFGIPSGVFTGGAAGYLGAFAQRILREAQERLTVPGVMPK